MKPFVFTKGNTDPIGDCGNFAAGLNVEDWGNRIEVYGSTPADAEALRDKFIEALAGIEYLQQVAVVAALITAEVDRFEKERGRPVKETYVHPSTGAIEDNAMTINMHLLNQLRNAVKDIK